MLRFNRFLFSFTAALTLLSLLQPEAAQARRRKLVINNVDFTSVNQFGTIADIYWPRGSGISYHYESAPWFGALLDNNGDGLYTDTVVVNQKLPEMVPGYLDPASSTVKWPEPYSNLNDDLTPNTADLDDWPDLFKVDGQPDLRGDQDIVVAIQDMTSDKFEATPLKLGVQFELHFWAFKREAAKDFFFLEMAATNRSAFIVDNSPPIQTGPFQWRNCYFALRCDPDMGPDYADDRSGFMRAKNLGFSFSHDLNDANQPQGFLGLKLLATPVVNGQELGLTNWTSIQNPSDPHIVPDPTDDNTQYRIIAAAPGQLLDPVYDPTKEFQFSGITGDTRQIMVSGPFDMNANDRQSMVIGFLFSMPTHDQPKFDTDEDVTGELDNLVLLSDAVQLFYDLGPLAQGAPTPGLSLMPGDGQVTVSWSAVVSPSPNIEIVQYKLYRATNAAGNDYKLLGTLAHENGKSYSLLDKAPELINGWKIYYAITVADKLSGELSDILGSGLQEGLPSFTLGNAIIPRSNPLALDDRETLKIRVVPNPFYAHAAWDNSPTEKHVQFTNLPASCTIRIFTLSGNLVNALQHSDGSGTENYNLRNRFGEPLASGIYYYVVTNSGGDNETGKFIVVQ
ncbi:MAG: T9SS type A sorting domain-containing protein [Candidatus Glassbacteria bacterium]